MDAEVVRQLRMGLEWVFLVREDIGSYRSIVWIVLYCCLNRIVLSAGLYRIGWIGSYCIGWTRKHWILCAGWLLAGWDRWDGWTGWGVGGTGLGRTDVITRQNGSPSIGARTGEPLLALERSWAVGSSGWHQLRWLCKGA